MAFGSKINELLSGKKTQKQRVNVYVTTENYDSFQKVCESKGLSVSETIDALMADFVTQVGPAKVIEISHVPKTAPK